MAIRLSGLNSGLDTDAIVQELVSAYSKKTEKYEKQQTKLTWKQDAWKSLNTKIYSLYTNASNMRMSSSYNLRKVSVSDNTKATVTASSSAVTGTQSLNIIQTAQASYITGKELDKDVTGNTTLGDLGYTGGNTSFAVKTADGEEKAIQITKSTKISDVVKQLGEAGLNASFDENNHRLFVSAKNSGTKADFDLIGNTADARSALSALGLNTNLVEVDKDGNKVFTTAAGVYAENYKHVTLAGGVDNVENYINSQIEAYKQLQETVKTQNVTLNTKKMAVTDAKAALTKAKDQKAAFEAHEDLYADLTTSGLASASEGLTGAQLADLVGNVYEDGAFTDDKKADTIAKIEEYLNNADNGVTLPTGKDSAQYAEELYTVLAENTEGMAKIDTYVGSNSDLLNSTADELATAVETAQEAYDNAVVARDAASADVEATKKQMEANPYGYIVEENETEEDQEKEIALIVARAKEADEVLNSTDSLDGAAVKVKAQDAVIEVNGARFTSESNTFNVNGLTINALAETKNGPIQITTNVDVDGIYDKIKDFLTEYNNVINEMAKLYNAESARDYEPLTDEEREAMSDEQIEKWENKIKDSLLRRDNSLNSIMSAMVNSMSQAIKIDGETLSLGTFGIQTLGFLNAAENEHYAYHIDGDEDDENTSGKKDKLRAAIEENPEQLTQFMQKLMENLYKSIDDKMKSTELSSAYKVYNDKELDKEQTRISQLISQWEEKISDKEDYYFKKFSQMEVALSKMQSQTNSLTGLFGQ